MISNSTEEGSPTGVFSSGAENEAASVSKKDVHTITVLDVLQGSKYTYVNVKEAEDVYWLATSKQPVDIGKAYFYKNALLKNNLYSNEFERTFERIYLVSQIVPVDHGSAMSSEPMIDEKVKGIDEDKIDVRREGSIRIADLLDNASNYNGQKIQVSGVVVKVNRKIMGRNWIHLKDGSNEEDLIVTSDVDIPEGHTVTMTGTVALQLDFGAGYRYDVLLEEGLLLME